MKKESWPDFPFSHWTGMEPTLQNIASYLHTETKGYRNAFISRKLPATEMEQRIIEHLTGVQQQLVVLTDVLQASLQIIHAQRTSQRVKRVLKWIRDRVRKFVQIIRGNTLWTILGALSTIAFVITVLVWLFHHFRR